MADQVVGWVKCKYPQWIEKRMAEHRKQYGAPDRGVNNEGRTLEWSRGYSDGYRAGTASQIEDKRETNPHSRPIRSLRQECGDETTFGEIKWQLKSKRYQFPSRR